VTALPGDRLVCKGDLSCVRSQIGDGKLSFASPDRMMKFLGVHLARSAFRVAGVPTACPVLSTALRTAEDSFHPTSTHTIALKYRDLSGFSPIRASCSTSRSQSAISNTR